VENLLTQLIFSTKNREPLLVGKELQQRTHAYLAAVLKEVQCATLIVGGVADQVHILCQLPKTPSVSDILEHLKVLLKMVEDSRKAHFQLDTGLRRYFGKPIARRCGDLLPPEARRPSPNDHLRGGISVNAQTLPGGF